MSSFIIEAVNCKGMAEDMIVNQDFAGARKMINKAKQIYPDLSYISQMQAVCDILCAANIELPGCGIDWYRVLRVLPSADDNTIKDQYLKLTSLLNPIENKFTGTESALKFIREGFSVLSNREMRSVFDMNRNGSRKVSGQLSSKVQMDSETAYPKLKASAELVVLEGETNRHNSASRKRFREVTRDENHVLSLSKTLPSKRPRDIDAVDWVMESPATTTVDDAEAKAEATCREQIICKPMKKINAKEVTVSAHMKVQGHGETAMDEDNLGHAVDADLDRLKTEIQGCNHKWSWGDFAKGQIWAVYDGPDAMPRLYVKVNDVISTTKVCVTYLEANPMNEDELFWVDKNLPLVCGIFRASKTTVNLEMSKFSYLVKCEWSMERSFYKIYPVEGEIWAVYKNWHRGWKLSDFNHHQCHVVEILSDFSEEAGTSIARLVQVKGYETFFQRQLYEGFALLRSLSRIEMLSFSHRIPAFHVPGIEKHGIPKDSWHLEPDALPPNSCE